ncbi:hypothetical protein [Ferrimonas kyonanensis]|uniref:hypothetical protein n=1 Tax=Ferrimonas kyonanensis TaxID=364763 RepID=UPI0012EBF5E8|nr:hypothetical protein [Ferrimonas kyonanensis]
MTIRTLWTLLFITVLQGCSDAPGPQRLPEHVALDLFTAIYVDQDTNKALPLIGGELLPLFHHYRLASQIQRQLFGLRLQQAEVELSSTDADFFRRRNQNMKVTIKLSGLKGDSVWQDLRQVQVEVIDNRWKVTKLINDPWLSNG